MDSSEKVVGQKNRQKGNEPEPQPLQLGPAFFGGRTTKNRRGIELVHWN